MRKFIPFFLILALAAASLAAINEPRDKTRVFNEIVMLRGTSGSPGTLEVNGVAIPVSPDRYFSCGLILDPGKNLVVASKGNWRQNLRLLRLLSFGDLEGKKHWARKQIIYLATLGVIEGYPDGNFYPGNPVTRGEFATWLVRAKKIPTPALSADVFFDVPKEHWRAPYIKAVVENGIMKGYSNGDFGIDDLISRKEATEAIVQSEGLGIFEKLKSFFLDVPREEKGSVPIYAAREKGLVVGVSRDFPIFDPDRALTRAEAATLIYRFDSMQRAAAQLDNYESGYDSKSICRINIPPEIISFWVEPAIILVGRKTALRMFAEIGKRDRLFPLAKVKADLRPLGGIPDAEMFDDGTNGDDVGGDGIYSLYLALSPSEGGEKTLRVTAVDRLGWETKKDAVLTIVK